MKAIRREVKYLALARGHPNILRMTSLFSCTEEDQGQSTEDEGSEGSAASLSFFPYAIVLQLACGDLHTFIKAEPVSDAIVLEIMVGLMSALCHLHHRQIVHRDVKPENILLDGQRILLADFGIAADLNNPVDMASRVGTPGYAAPEIVTDLGVQVTEKIDLFSSGVVLYFTMYNVLPFEASTNHRMMERTARCRVVYPPLEHRSPKFLVLLKALLMKYPHRRPSASRACQALCSSSHDMQQSAAISESFKALPKKAQNESAHQEIEERDLISPQEPAESGSTPLNQSRSNTHQSQVSEGDAQSQASQGDASVSMPSLSRDETISQSNRCQPQEEQAEGLSATSKMLKHGMEGGQTHKPASSASEAHPKESPNSSPKEKADEPSSAEAQVEKVASNSSKPSGSSGKSGRVWSFVPKISKATLWNPFTSQSSKEPSEMHQESDGVSPQPAEANLDDVQLVPRPPPTQPPAQPFRRSGSQQQADCEKQPLLE